MTDPLVLDMLGAARPGVERRVLADFMAGQQNTPYLHVSPAEFHRIADFFAARSASRDEGMAAARGVEVLADRVRELEAENAELRRRNTDLNRLCKTKARHVDNLLKKQRKAFAAQGAEP